MCSFQIPFSVTADELVEKANNAIVKAGGTFTGNNTSGKYSVATKIGEIAGTYIINSQTATFTITDKPFFVPCNMIQERLGEMFGSSIA